MPNIPTRPTRVFEKPAEFTMDYTADFNDDIEDTGSIQPPAVWTIMDEQGRDPGVVPPELRNVGQSETQKTASIVLEGGVPGRAYWAICQASTNATGTPELAASFLIHVAGLVSLEATKRHADDGGTQAHEVWDQILRGIGSALELTTGLLLWPRYQHIDEYDGDGTSTFVLPGRIRNVSTLVVEVRSAPGESWTTVDAGDITLLQTYSALRGSLVLDGAVFPEGTQTVRLTWDPGYIISGTGGDRTPHALDLAIMQSAGLSFRGRVRRRSTTEDPLVILSESARQWVDFVLTTPEPGETTERYVKVLELGG